MTAPDNNPPHARGGDVLAFGFLTAVAMWAVGYVTHLPVLEKQLPGALVFALLMAVVPACGFLFGKTTRRTFRGALVASLVTAAVNLLVIGSVIADPEARKTLSIALPGYFFAHTALFLLGHAIGRKTQSQPPTRENWLPPFVIATLAATALVVIAGGLVTGHDAGFAVPDWPTSFESNMFLYPLSKMTGGIYYEHAHRLFGTLVGLNALVLLAYTWATPQRRAVRTLTTVAFVAVVVQGVMGGLWVELKGIGYILFHGTFGQIILALFAALLAMTSAAWADKQQRLAAPKALTDRVLGIVAIVALMLQLALGVLLRKNYNVLLEHIVFAFVVAGIAIVLAIRVSAYYSQVQTLKRLAGWVSLTLVVQIALGFVALLARQKNPVAPPVGSDTVNDPVDAFLTTLHQSVGAALLALVVTLTVCVFRFVHRPQSAAAVTSKAQVSDATNAHA